MSSTGGKRSLRPSLRRGGVALGAVVALAAAVVPAGPAQSESGPRSTYIV
jgi:hypothetical protein